MLITRTEQTRKAARPEKAPEPKPPGKSALSVVTDSSLMGVVDIVSVGGAVGHRVAGSLSLDAQALADFSKGAVVGHSLFAVANGYQSVRRGSKAHGVTALGHIASAVGHGALLAGSGHLGLGLVIGGSVLSNIAGQRKS